MTQFISHDDHTDEKPDVVVSLSWCAGPFSFYYFPRKPSKWQQATTLCLSLPFVRCGPFYDEFFN
jgi:hypothetical protein